MHSKRFIKYPSSGTLNSDNLKSIHLNIEECTGTENVCFEINIHVLTVKKTLF